MIWSCFFPSRRRHTRFDCDWSSDVCSSDLRRRKLVLEAIQEVCSYRGWRLLAAHVRSSHVHAVVVAEDMPERVLQGFKASDRTALGQRARAGGHVSQRPLAGSTRYLW